MIVLIDNGHGQDTAGKRSPDGRLREYAYAREIAVRLEQALKEKGIESIRITPEESDISLSERCRRANAYCKQYGTKNVILISLHCNAAGADGQWHEASGWSSFVSKNASASSKELATFLADAAGEAGLKIRVPSPKQKYWVQNLAICRDTSCPAVLTENLFQDNKDDVDYLLSEAGKEAITALHVNGITNYIASL